jgi:hypothetical protein
MYNSNLQNITVEYGGINFLNKNGDIYIPYLIFYIMGFTIGCTGIKLVLPNYSIPFHK